MAERELEREGSTDARIRVGRAVLDGEKDANRDLVGEKLTRAVRECDELAPRVLVCELVGFAVGTGTEAKAVREIEWLPEIDFVDDDVGRADSEEDGDT